MNTTQWQTGEGNEYLSLDFARCQRQDGSYYGTGGQCRKGTPVGPREIKAIAKKAKDGDARAQKALEKMAADGDKDAKKALEAMGGKTAEKKPEEKKPENSPPAKQDPDDEAAEVLKKLTPEQDEELTAKVAEDMEDMDALIQDVSSKLNQEEDIVDDEVSTVEAWREGRINEYTKGVETLVVNKVTTSEDLDEEIGERKDMIKDGDGDKAKLTKEIKQLEKAKEFTDADEEIRGEFERYTQNRNGLGQSDERNVSYALSGLHPTVQPDDDFNDMAVALGEKAYANIPGKKAPSEEQALAMGLQLMSDNYGGFNIRDFRGADGAAMESWMGGNPYYSRWNGPGDGPS